MTIPKFHLSHKEENTDALTLGERRQLQNILISVFSSLCDLHPAYLYEHSQIVVNEHNATMESSSDSIKFLLFTDEEDHEENEQVGSLTTYIDDEDNTLTLLSERKGKQSEKLQFKAWYRSDDDTHLDKLESETIQPLYDFAEKFLGGNIDEYERNS